MTVELPAPGLSCQNYSDNFLVGSNITSRSPDLGTELWFTKLTITDMSYFRWREQQWAAKEWMKQKSVSPTLFNSTVNIRHLFHACARLLTNRGIPNRLHNYFASHDVFIEKVNFRGTEGILLSFRYTLIHSSQLAWVAYRSSTSGNLHCSIAGPGAAGPPDEN